MYYANVMIYIDQLKNQQAEDTTVAINPHFILIF